MSSPDLGNFIDTLQSVRRLNGSDVESGPYSILALISRLQAACKSSPAAANQINGWLPGAQNASGTIFDGKDCSVLASSVLASSLAVAITMVDDSHGFAGSVNKEVASNNIKSGIDSLVPYVFGDGLVREIMQAGFPPLSELMRDAQWVADYKALFHSKTFIHSVNAQDAAVKNSCWGSTVVFIYCYFEVGGDYTKLKSLMTPEYLAPLASKWLSALVDDSVTDPAKFQDAVLYSAATFSKLLPGQDTASPLQAIAAQLSLPILSGLSQEQMATARETVLHLDPSAVAEYNALSGNVQVAWTFRLFLDYKTSMETAIRQTDVRVEPYYTTTCSSRTCTRIQGGNTIYTRYGDYLSTWIADANGFVAQPCFGAPPSPDARTTRQGPDNHDTGSCFVPGTMVLTDSGEKPIEKLAQWDRVVTWAPTGEMGIRSDENVANPTTLRGRRVLIFGFNGMKPFFTANHVFYTTTGLRAVDPVGAMKENPWLSVKQLGVGHQVLHASRVGEGYKPVTIHSLHHERAESKYVYGVHLHEGRRSYHANGFLVRLNYPEITIKTLARDILALEREVRLKVLAAARELGPIFARFGGDTVIQALTREAKIGGTVKHEDPDQRVDISHLNRSWELKATSAESESTVLPIAVQDGTVYVGGRYCERAIIKHNSVRWSRKLEDGKTWEHGAVRFRSRGRSGVGVLFESEDESPCERLSCQVLRHFTVSAASLKAGSAVSLAAATDSVVATSAMVAAATVDPDDDSETFRVTYQDVSPDAPDKSEKPFFDIGLHSKHPLDKKIFTENARVPQLDRLQAHLTKQLEEVAQRKGTKDAKIQADLYESVLTTDGEGRLVYNITLNHPDQIYLASDQAEAAPTGATPVYTNLTFQNIGFDETLPIIPQTISFTLVHFGSKLHGSIGLYEPGKPDMVGEHRNINGKYVDPDETAGFTARVAAAGDALASFNAGASALRGIHEAHSIPALATAGLAEEPSDPNSLSEDKLADLSGWDDVELHKDTQTLIYKCMLYHVDDFALNKIFREKRPEKGSAIDQLDMSLADDLNTDTKNWIKDVYGPAMVCRRIASLSADDRNRLRENFTNAEERRLNWALLGQGPKTLYGSPHYHVLNDIGARVATLARHPDLKRYLEDGTPDPTTGKKGGTKWSDLFYESASAPPSLRQIKESLKPPPAGAKATNLLTKYCNIMHALDSSKTNANKLAAKVGKSAAMDVSRVQSELEDDTEATIAAEQSWLSDNMKYIIQKLLEGKNIVTENVDKSLRDQIDEVANEFNINAAVDALEKAETICELTSDLIQSMAILARSMKLSSLKIDKWEGFKGWLKATKVGNWVAKQYAKPKVAAALKEIMIIGTLAGWVGSAIIGFKKWDDMSDDEKAVLVEETVVQVGQTLSDNVFLYEEYMKNEKAYVAAQLEEADRRNAIELEDLNPQPDAKAQQENAVALNEEAESLNSRAPETLRSRVGKFNRTANWVRGAVMVATAVLVITTAVFLFNHLASMDAVNKFGAITQFALQTLSLMTGAIEFAAEAAYTMEVITEAAFTTTMAVTAFAGAALAVLGIAAMIAVSIWQALEPPPLSPVEEWIRDHGRPFLDTLPEPPTRQLSYSVTAMRGPSLSKIIAEAKNTGTSAVTVKRINVIFPSGDDAATLFTETDFPVTAGSASPTSTAAGVAAVVGGPGGADVKFSASCVAYSWQQTAEGGTLYRQTVSLGGDKPAGAASAGKLTVPPGATVSVVLQGTMAKDGVAFVTINEVDVEGNTLDDYWIVTKPGFTVSQ